MQELRSKYDVAAENLLTLFEVLRFQVYLEQQDKIAEFPEEIPDEQVIELYRNPSRLPRSLQGFLRLMNDDFEADEDKILGLNMPTGLEKYFVKNVLLKRKKQKERDRIIAEFMRSMLEFTRRLFQTRAIFRATNAHYNEVRRGINEELAHLDSKEASKLADIINEMDNIENDLRRLNDKLRDENLENTDQLDQIRQKIEDDNVEIAHVESRFRERLRMMRRYWARNLDSDDSDASLGVVGGTIRAAQSVTSAAGTVSGVAGTVASAVGTVVTTAGAVVTVAVSGVNEARQIVNDVFGEDDEEGEAPADFWAEEFDENGNIPNNDPDD